MTSMERVNKAHEISKRAYDAAMRELTQSDELGIMLAAMSKCAAWLTAETMAAAYLVDDELASRHATRADEEAVGR